MKKILSLLLAATLGLSLSACGRSEKTETKCKEKIKIRWYGVCSFEIIVNGKHIVTDPYISFHKRNGGLTVDNIEDCETVLISHGHYDHIMDLPEITEKYSPRILAGTLTANPLTEYCNAVPRLFGRP